MKSERRPILRKRLDADACDLSTDDFFEAVCTQFAIMYRTTDEDILHEPDEAKNFCNEVRRRIHAKVCDRTILRTLTNARKYEGRPEND